MSYIISTLSNNVSYAIYEKSGGGLPVLRKTIEIKGGANVINRSLLTLDGVATSVSEEDLKLLKDHPVFKQHLEGGFVKIQSSSEVKTSDLTEKDLSAQLVAKDFSKKGKKAPKISKE